MLVKLGNVCEIVMGQSPPSETYNTEKLGLPFFQGKAEFTDLYPVVHKYCNKPNKIAEPNDILLSVRAPVGATNVANQRCCIGRGLAAIRYKNWKYVFYFLRSIEKDLDKKGTGTTFKAISGETIRETLMPLPSTEIQQQIVYKIEELFSELDKGTEELKTAQQQLKVYRQAVYNSAIRSAELKTIECVIEKLDQGWSPKCYNEPSTVINEWAVIKTTAIQAGYFLENENKRLPENLEPRKQHELKAGDILITRAGPRVRVGVCCMVKHTRPKLINCDKVYRIRINTKVALPEYIELLLNSPVYSREIERMKTGINDSGVNLTQKGFVNILIPIPSLEEQQQIIQEIESRL
ncbi:MAG TPA: restriction endonuclease subunit S, partial [Chondromyces sp.]|nr:restriction endonuclease subunit S [Chondromyces sp.]